MDVSTCGTRSTEGIFTDNCSYEMIVAEPRDKTDITDAIGLNEPTVNQGLESTKEHHLQIAISPENGEICDTDSRDDLCLKSTENRKCDRYENLAQSLSLNGHEQKAGRYTFISEDECRICQSGGEEALISPCKCSGSAKWVHESCIVKWFQISETSSCELCAHDVSIKKRTKPLHQVSVTIMS